jgi:hypothetical protein
MIVYHASPHLFAKPDLMQMAAHRTNHPNGGLGLWVANDPSWIRGFGDFLYEILFEGSSVSVPVSELASWGPDLDYGAKRNELLLGSDYLEVLEADGISRMGVILALDKITSLTLIQRSV